MNNIALIIENIITHKEKIAPSISDAIINRKHYNANNIIYPDTVGRGNFLLDESLKNFKGVLNRIKRVYNITSIEPKKYFEIKNSIGGLLKEIAYYEKPIISKLDSLADYIIRDYYNLPNDITFEFKDSSEDFLDDYNDNIIDGYKEDFEELKFDDYSSIDTHNKNIDRYRINFSLICGASNHTMGLYTQYGDLLDDIDYRLQNMYDKFSVFNEFNIWVTPDEILTSNIDSIGGFKIYDNNKGYRIAIESSNFISKLYEMSKAVLSILFQEKYNIPYIDYDSPWNTRIGVILWRKFIKCANQKQHLPYVIDAMNQFSDNDYSYIMKEIMSDTNHSHKIFKELYKTL